MKQIACSCVTYGFLELLDAVTDVFDRLSNWDFTTFWEVFNGVCNSEIIGLWDEGSDISVMLWTHLHKVPVYSVITPGSPDLLLFMHNDLSASRGKWVSPEIMMPIHNCMC